MTLQCRQGKLFIWITSGIQIFHVYGGFVQAAASLDFRAVPRVMFT
jgi:hypothetical protein